MYSIFIRLVVFTSLTFKVNAMRPRLARRTDDWLTS